MSLPTISIASIAIGFISFGFTLLTWLGVYLGLVQVMRSAPRSIPLTLGNVRQELLTEKALTRRTLRIGDRFGVFPARKGKEDAIRLINETLRQTWKEFKAVEAKFVVRGEHDVEGGEAASEAETENGFGDEKRGARGRRPLSRKQSHVTSRMGLWEAGLSIDRKTYYNTDLAHRFLWWWKQDAINNLQDRIQRLQLRRMEMNLFEVNELGKRVLIMSGGIAGRNVGRNGGWSEDGWDDSGGSGSDDGGGGGGDRRGGGGGGNGRRSSYARRVPSHRRSRGRHSTAAYRDVYEKEVVRVRERDRSEHSLRARTDPNVPGRRRSRAASRGPRSDVEYEIVQPERIYVEVEDGRSAGRPDGGRMESYQRERAYRSSSRT